MPSLPTRMWVHAGSWVIPQREGSLARCRSAPAGPSVSWGPTAPRPPQGTASLGCQGLHNAGGLRPRGAAARGTALLMLAGGSRTPPRSRISLGCVRATATAADGDSDGEDAPRGAPVSIAEVGAALLMSGNEVVSAAAVLGENQKLDENPGSLSGAGCALANAGREAQQAGAFASRMDGENGDWDQRLGNIAAELAAAAAFFAETGAAEVEPQMEAAVASLESAAMALLDARFVDCSQQGGWIVTDASMSLEEAGAALVEAAEGIAKYASAMETEVGPCGVAAAHLSTAATSLQSAGRQLQSAGASIQGS